MKLIKKVAFGVVAVAVASTLISSQVFAAAQNDIFGGVKVNESTVLPPPPQYSVDTAQPSNGNLNYVTSDEETLQNAMNNLNSAQATLRSDLGQAQTQYAEVDKRFKQVKLERKYAKGQIRDLNRKLRNIECAKKKIRKNLTKGI